VLVTFKQDVDGTEKDEGSGHTKVTPTQFAAMGFAYFDETSGAKGDDALLHSVDWLIRKIGQTGELRPNMSEPPLAQGSQKVHLSFSTHPLAS
jgi:hypothetical protein